MSTATPYDDVCAELGRLLDRRLSDSGLPGDQAAVVPLGVANVFDPTRDTAAARRAEARVHVTPQAVLVGPWAAREAHSVACGHCLALRWQGVRTRLERQGLEDGPPARVVGRWPILTDFLIDTVWQAYRQAYLDPPRDGDATWVTRIDLGTLAVQTVPILVEPDCPSCREVGPRDTLSALADLRSRTKTAPDAYRLRRPADYRLPGDALANPVCGVLGTGTGMALTSPTMAPVAGNTVTRGSVGLFDVNWSGQSTGYGASHELAFLEGLERFSGTVRRGNIEVVVDSLDNLGAEALDPRDCGVYPDATYDQDPAVSPFTPDRKIPWVWGYSIRDQRRILVPSRISYYSSGSVADNFVFECSNGCAGGSCVEEAILFGMLELMERDAFLIGWFAGAELPEIDAHGIEDTGVRTMIDRAALRGYDVRLFDNRVDLAVPVVTGVAVRRDGGDGLLSFASGASLDPLEAVRGALSEILTYIPSMPGQVAARRGELEAMTRDYSLVRDIHDHAPLFGLPEMRPHADRYLSTRDTRPLGELYRGWNAVRPRTLDLRDDLLFCRDELVRAGHDVIVVDQTPPRSLAGGVASVAVIAPGLIPIDFGWGRQRAPYLPRMSSAPRRAGWHPTQPHLVPHPFP